MTNIQTGVACLYLVTTQLWPSLFSFYKGSAVCTAATGYNIQETKSHSLVRYFRKYYMFQSELVELTVWAVIKIPWFLSLVGQIRLLISSAHFPGNAGCIHRLTHYGLREHRIPCRGWRLEDSQDKGRFWVEHLRVVCQQPDKENQAGSLQSGGSSKSSIGREERSDLFIKQFGYLESWVCTSGDSCIAMTSVCDEPGSRLHLCRYKIFLSLRQDHSTIHRPRWPWTQHFSALDSHVLKLQACPNMPGQDTFK